MHRQGVELICESKLLHHQRPFAAGTDNQLSNFTHGTIAAMGACHIVGTLNELGAGVANGNGKTAALQKRIIREIITDKSHAFISQIFLLQNFLIDALFFQIALIDITNLEDASALGHGLRITTADNAGFYTDKIETVDAGAVLAVEALKLGRLAVRTGEIEEIAVGQNSIDIH